MFDKKNKKIRVFVNCESTNEKGENVNASKSFDNYYDAMRYLEAKEQEQS